MLAQPASSQAAEKTVIAGFNRKLATKITAFKQTNAGVSACLPFLLPIKLIAE
jgi:hypothetical protein